MKLQDIERCVYLVQHNLFWSDENGFHDWQKAEVTNISNGNITLKKGDEYCTWDINELSERCEQLCDEHFSLLRK